MRQPQRKTHRGNGGFGCHYSDGFLLAHNTPNLPGWIFVLGDSDALEPVPVDRSIPLLVRIAYIIGEPELVRGCAEVRSILTVSHRGAEVRIRADDSPQSLMHIIESRRIGGAR